MHCRGRSVRQCNYPRLCQHRLAQEMCTVYYISWEYKQSAHDFKYFGKLVSLSVNIQTTL